MRVHLPMFATGPHHHLQSEVWTNRHPASSTGVSWQCETSSGSRPHEHRSVRPCHLFLQVPQWPNCAIWKRFSRDHCCPGRSQAGCRIVGSATKLDWPLEPKSSSPFKNVWCQLVLCIATAGCVDFLEGEPA